MPKDANKTEESPADAFCNSSPACFSSSAALFIYSAPFSTCEYTVARDHCSLARSSFKFLIDRETGRLFGRRATATAKPVKVTEDNEEMLRARFAKRKRNDARLP